MSDDLEIRPLRDWHEMADVVAIQQSVWGENPADLIHQHMLVSIARNGGLVLGAFVKRKMVGCLIGFLGTEADDESRPAMADLKLFSKRLAVLSEYREQGIGYRLKLAQRDFAMRRGIRLVTWTFDPLMSRSAHMNIRKLGAVVSRYFVDYYGTEPGSLVVAGSSDRLQADWWLTSRRVRERLKGSREALSLSHYLEGGVRILNPTTLSDEGLPMPGEGFIQPPGKLGLVEIPADYDRLVEADLPLAISWREHSRLMFNAVLNAGYILTDFVFEPYQGRQRSFYVCSYEGSLRPFSQN